MCGLGRILNLTKVKEDVVVLKSLEIGQHLFGLAGREEHVKLIKLTWADQAAHKGVFSVYSTFVGQRCR